MANSRVVETEKLSVVAEFTDNDTRTITIDNPKATIESSEVQALQTSAAKVLIGDLNGAAFSRLKSIDRIRDIKTYLEF